MKVVSKKLAKSIVMQLNLALLCIKEPGQNVVVCILLGKNKYQKDGTKNLVEHLKKKNVLSHFHGQ